MVTRGGVDSSIWKDVRTRCATRIRHRAVLFSALLASQGRFQSAPTGDQCSSCCSATRNQPLGLLIATAGLTCLIASPTTSAAVTSKLNSLPYALRLRGPNSAPCAGCCCALIAPIFCERSLQHSLLAQSTESSSAAASWDTAGGVHCPADKLQVLHSVQRRCE